MRKVSGYKQVIVVREDLKLSKGKTAAQVAHACLSAVLKSSKEVVNKWEREGQKKVILGVKTLEELEEIEKRCKKAGIPCSLIIDAGRTELEPGTVTALGVGPADEKKIDKVTGNLKLLK